MKVKKIDTKIEDFTPITIEITFESLKEVVDMWLRCNAHINDVKASNIKYEASVITHGSKYADVVNSLINSMSAETLWISLDRELYPKKYLGKQ